MDEYKQVGPEKPGYAEDVNHIAGLLRIDGVVLFKFAANATAKHVMLALLDEFPGAVLHRPEGFATQNALLVAIDGTRNAASWLPWEWGSTLHPGYVGDYIGHHWGWSNVDNPNSEPFVRFLNDLAAVPVSRWYEGVHDGCAFDYRHNHATAPLRNVLTGER